MKVLIREKIIQKRLSLKSLEIKDKSDMVFKNFLKTDLLFARKILLYLPIKNEVETKNILDFYLKKGASVFLPKFDGDSWGIAKFINYDDLEKGPFDTQQPKGKLATSDIIDLAIVPGVAFSKNGVRIGFGKGIYDMILPKLKTFIVGLCYDFQIIDKTEKAAHDVLIDMIISESEVLNAINY